MLEEYFLTTALTAALVYIIVLSRNSNRLKVNNFDLANHADNLSQELDKKNANIVVLSSQSIVKDLIINKFQTRYEPILNLEENTEMKRLEFNSSLKALEELNIKYIAALKTYESIERQIQIYSNDLELIRFGLYTPQFDYFTSEEYKQKIDLNYIKQRDCLVSNKAAISHTESNILGDDKKVTSTFKRLMLFAFNGECDALIAKMKWNTATRTIEKLDKSFEMINKLGRAANVEITRDFFSLKMEELALTHEFENKKQEEKEEQRRIRESMREEEKALRDFELARKEAEEDEKRYQKALKRVREDLRYAGKEEVASLNEKITELESKLKEAGIKRERAISMAQQTKVGHIYIISNIGSFGENIYKIGMTRRLEPLDRVKELSDAALPFRYDVHAVIFSENAPQLERELHKRFDKQRINRVNGRKEFFKVTLDQIEDYVNAHTNADIKFTLLAEAREFRETLTLMDAELKTVEDIAFKSEMFPQSLI